MDSFSYLKKKRKYFIIIYSFLRRRTTVTSGLLVTLEIHQLYKKFSLHRRNRRYYHSKSVAAAKICKSYARYWGVPKSLFYANGAEIISNISVLFHTQKLKLRPISQDRSQHREKTKGDLLGATESLARRYREDRARLFPAMHSNRTGATGHQSKQGKSQPDTGKNALL